MKTEKAGCFVVNVQTKKVALVHREKQQDYSFPKGHMEQNETWEECALRETAEETKRVCKIVDNNPIVEEYVTPKGEECICKMFLAVDEGVSDNKSEDTHETVWVDVNSVENVLSYESLKQTWREILPRVEKMFEKIEKHGNCEKLAPITKKKLKMIH